LAMRVSKPSELGVEPEATESAAEETNEEHCDRDESHNGARQSTLFGLSGGGDGGGLNVGSRVVDVGGTSGLVTQRDRVVGGILLGYRARVS
jgi:hypothetical protein